MNKVLFISHGLENSAWGTVSRNLILAMDQAGIDVVPRFIRLGKATASLPTRIHELEQKTARGCNICLQLVLPHYFVKHGAFKKNIGYVMLEHHGLKNTKWCRHINLMDEIWAPCKETLEYKCQDGITPNMFYVPFPFDLNIYNKEYKPFKVNKLNDFTFYFIGELHRRKHLSSLLRAFHSEFHSSEPVSIVLKVGKFGYSPEEVVEETKNICSQVKDSIRLYKDKRMYKQEIIVGDYLTDEEIYGLHTSCDCFVSSTYGEAFNIPAFEATLFGNPALCTGYGGMADYIINAQTGILLNAQQDGIIGLTEMFDGIGTGREWWWNINNIELQFHMRHAYNAIRNKSISKSTVKSLAMNTALQFSYEYVGNKIKELLNA